MQFIGCLPHYAPLITKTSLSDGGEVWKKPHPTGSGARSNYLSVGKALEKFQTVLSQPRLCATLETVAVEAAATP